MRIEAAEKGHLKGFVDYCKRHRGEVDESFLCDSALDGFVPDGENPAVVALDDGGRVVGAGSLIADEYMRRGNRARFRILHCETGDGDCYAGMLRALLPHAAGLANLFIYAPEQNTPLRAALAALGFQAERFSFYMVREGCGGPEPVFPEGFRLALCMPGRDEQPWCDVRNAAFAKLRGGETPMAPEMAARRMFGSDAIEGGALMLRRDEEPVGVALVGRDDYEGEEVAEIGPLAVMPAWQGKGLGRNLLRAALRVARERGFRKAALCVNAENERASTLYVQEGFRIVESVICYRYELDR